MSFGLSVLLISSHAETPGQRARVACRQSSLQGYQRKPPRHLDVDSATTQSATANDDERVRDSNSATDVVLNGNGSGSNDPSTWKESRPGSVFAVNNDLKSVEELYANTPSEEEVLLEGVLKKRCVSDKVYWADRYVCLTKERLCLANQKGGRIREQIYLRAMSAVQRKVRTHDVERRGYVEAQPESPASTPDAVCGSPTPEPDRQEGEREGPGKRVGKGPSQFRLMRDERTAIFRVDEEEEVDRFISQPMNNTLAFQGESMKNIMISTTPGGTKSTTLHDHQWEYVVEILVATWGRTYYLKASSQEECDRWVAVILGAQAECEAEHERRLHTTWFQRTSFQVRLLSL